MIGYSTIGSKDLAKAVAFYDDLLSLVGGKWNLIVSSSTELKPVAQC